ncbi:MAG: 50S ribosomal protein L11 methyltransferase [Lactobacillus sp.]|nr:50S ribosomal protein L11 methyltransferase [Lactobacillus sp.]
MKLLRIEMQISHEIEDAMVYFLENDLHALGTEMIRRSDFETAEDRHDSTLVVWEDVDVPEDIKLFAYFSSEEHVPELTEKIQAKFKELASYGLQVGEGQLTHDYIKDEDWNTVWKKYYHPIQFSRYLAIVPEWENYTPAFSDQQVIKLDPGLAFGTGNHETTKLAMLCLERVMTKPKSVVDVGTGSGILAIASKKFGASSVLATDITDESINATHENMALNQIEDIEIQKTSLLSGISGKFDVIIANILAEILLELIPQLDEHLNEGGQIIFSGIDYLQLPKIEQALDQIGMQVSLKLQEKRWIGLIITRKP